MRIQLPKLSVPYVEKRGVNISQLLALGKEIDSEPQSINAGGKVAWVISDNTQGGNDTPILLVGSRTNIPRDYQKVLYVKDLGERIKSDLTKAIWIRHPQIDHGLANPVTPEDVLGSWNTPFTYREENEGEHIVGLRPPQIGAIHGTYAHWIVSNEPGTIVMPTGTGKTEVMLSILVSRPCLRVLVIVPTDALRNQLASKFGSLGILKSAGVIPESYLFPVVGVITKKPQTTQEIDDVFQKCNVVVTTINIAGQVSETMQERMASYVDCLFIDEAHHLGAKTWKDLKDKFADKLVLQFTATPFRNDDKVVEGKIVFKYPLKKALEDGYFRKIHFKPISEFDPEQSDIIIAEKAVEQLRRDPPRHILMARVGTISRAADVFRIYQQYEEFNPVQIHTGMGKRALQEAREALLSGQSRIVVCVDMLGEGFDLPELKIAAFHDIKKSLAVTLQVAGRFTRSRDDLGDPTFVANIADVDVRHELKKLYEQDTDWNTVLEQSSEDAIGGQIALYEFAEGFRDFPEEIPLQNLYPATSTVVYRTHCEEWRPENFEKGLRGISGYDKMRHGINQAQKTLVIVTAKKIQVDWIRVNDVFNWDWELYIVHWDQQRNLLYIHSSSNAGYFKSLAEAIADRVELVRDDQVFRAFAGINRLRLFSIGLRRQLGRLIRYVKHAGSDVAQGISDAQTRNVIRTDYFGAGYADGARTSIGCSRKGRIWSRRVVNVEVLIRWLHSIGTKILDDSIDPDTILNKALKPQMVMERPRKFPIRIDWPEVFYLEPETEFTFYYGETRVPLYISDIELTEPSTDGTLHFKVSSPDQETEFALNISRVPDENELSTFSFRRVSGNVISISFRGRRVPLEDFFNENPPSIWFTDGASLEGNILIELQENRDLFSDSKITVWDWSGVNKRNESQGMEKDTTSIQYRVIQELITRNYEVVVNDDGKGEIADVVAVKTETKEGIQFIQVDLFHCKYSSSNDAGHRLEDLYEVCGQAQRSAHWKEKVSQIFTHILRREPLRGHGQEVSRFEFGDKNTFEKLHRMTEVTDVRIKVHIVQPGVSKAQISDEQRKLLAVTENYLMETYELPLELIASV